MAAKRKAAQPPKDDAFYIRIDPALKRNLRLVARANQMSDSAWARMVFLRAIEADPKAPVAA